MTSRYFEFTDDTSNKFWEVTLDGKRVLTRYGRIGAAGQTTVKDEASDANAQKLFDKLIREKTGKGYLERLPAAAAPVAPPVPVPVDRSASPVEPGYRRFEFSEGTSNKFWEVNLEGDTQTIRYGKIGTDGQQKDKVFDSRREARDDTAKLIKEKLGKGYVEVGVPPRAPSNPQLEAAIEANLDAPEPYLVYADWLTAQGDPRGEFIVLQAQGQHAEANALLAKNADAWLGPLTEFTHEVPDPEQRWHTSERGFHLEWQHGFIKHLSWHWDAFDYDTEDDPGSDLKALLQLPAARFIQSLRLGPCPGEETMDPSPLVDAMLEVEGPRTLRTLFLADRGDWDISGTLSGNFGALHHLFPKLKSLTLHGGQIEFGKKVSLPELEELTLQSGGLDQAVVREVLRADLPKLKRLSIWFGDANYGASGTVDDLRALFDGKLFPQLEHLGVMNCAWVGDAARALATSKLLPKLTSLDLSMGALSDGDVDAMVASQAAFAHLTHLNLENNALTKASRPKVAGLAKTVNFGKDDEHDAGRADGDYRYVAVGE